MTLSKFDNLSKFYKFVKFVKVAHLIRLAPSFPDKNNSISIPHEPLDHPLGKIGLCKTYSTSIGCLPREFGVYIYIHIYIYARAVYPVHSTTVWSADLSGTDLILYTSTHYQLCTSPHGVLFFVMTTRGCPRGTEGKPSGTH